ncbi:hypothetical protein BGX38DRAFT_1196367 [Terfezia claveryi]|nr:hypothetical protein BGX38DRAFT_1196367 [Terfezia claveryi]
MSQVHPSRHSLVPQSKSNPPRKPPHKHKRKAPTTVAEASAAAPTSISHLRRKIRDLTRLLSRSNTSTSTPADGNLTLPPAAIIQTERALASYKRDLALLQQCTKERKLNDRYRMVRFFERQKSTRNLRKLTRQSPPASPTQLLTARLNLNYTLYYPPHRKYISLYRDCSSDPKTQRAKEEILKDIKQRMDEGTLGKWVVNVGTDHDLVLDDDEELDAEEGGVQLGGHGAEEEEQSKPNKKRNIDKKSKEQRHNDKSDKSSKDVPTRLSKDKSKSNPKKKHKKNGEQEEQEPVVLETGGFFEF